MSSHTPAFFPTKRSSLRFGLPGILWTIYLSTAPIYWIPQAPLSILLTAKFLIIALAVIVTLVSFAFSSRPAPPMGYAGVSGVLIILVAATPALAASSTAMVTAYLADLAYAFTAFFVFNFLIKARYNVVLIFHAAAICIALFCAATIVAALIPIFDARQPQQLGNFTLSVAGFGGLRTGWSNGVSLFLPLLFLGLNGSNGKPSSARLGVSIIAAALILGSQYVVGGRAGLVSSLTAILILGHYLLPAGKRIAAAAMLTALVLFASGPALYEQLRIDRLAQAGGDISIETLDHFSANRITTYQFALKKMSERPLTGYGISNADLAGHEIHNVWLRLGAEGGVFLMIAQLALLLFILLPPPRRYRHGHLQRERLAVAVPIWACLVGGAIISMLEPRMLFGSFQASAVWWCAAGSYVAIRQAPIRPQQ